MCVLISITVYSQKKKKILIKEVQTCSWPTWTKWNNRSIFNLYLSLIRYLISVIFTWFFLSSYLLKFLVFLYFFWFDLICIYIYLFICALKEWENFRLIYKGFTCKMGLSQLNQANLHPARHEFKRRPTQLNLSPTGARNQRKFAPNLSPIQIRIPACTSVSIFGITFGSNIQDSS